MGVHYDDQTVVVTYEDEGIGSEVEYTFEQLFMPARIPFSTVCISTQNDGPPISVPIVIHYGQEVPLFGQEHTIHIRDSTRFWRLYENQAPLPWICASRLGETPVVVPPDDGADLYVCRSGQLTSTNADIVASSFALLSRYEEIRPAHLDAFDRFPAEASAAKREGFLQRPVVNEYIDLLYSMLAPFVEIRPVDWEGAPFCLCLTHDIDEVKLFRNCRRVLSSIYRSFARRWNPTDPIGVAADCCGVLAGVRKDPHDDVEMLIGIEREYGISATYFFMAGETSKRYDGRYKISEQGQLLRAILDAGGEVGLHGSFDSYLRHEVLLGERRRLEDVLGAPVRGNRQHYLRWETPATWAAIEAAGFEYDSTLGYASTPGFRSGICYPYRPFDVTRRRQLDLWEIPLIAMDASLLGCQGCSPDEAANWMYCLVDAVRRHRGIAVLLWHSGVFYERENPGVLRAYRGLLERITALSPYSATLEDALMHWIGRLQPPIAGGA